MPTISAGSSATLTLGATESYEVSTTGDAVVSLLSGMPGAPFESIRIAAGQVRRFGPYGGSARINVAAASGETTYDSSSGASAFSSVLKLSGSYVMPMKAVAGPLAFSVDANVRPAEGARVLVDLAPDGYNVPTFTGMVEADFSSGYVNTNGVRNMLTFWVRAGVVYYSINQRLGATVESSLLTNQIVRLGTLNLLTESGDANNGWSYRHQGNVSNYSASGKASLGFPLNGDGEITCRLNQVATGGILGFYLYPSNGSPNVSDYRGSTQYGFLIAPPGSTNVFNSGTGEGAVATWTFADNDVARLKRIGTVLTAEIYSGGSWTTVKTWTGVSRQAWNPWMLFNGASGPMVQALNLRGVGLV